MSGFSGTARGSGVSGQSRHRPFRQASLAFPSRVCRADRVDRAAARPPIPSADPAPFGRRQFAVRGPPRRERSRCHPPADAVRRSGCGGSDSLNVASTASRGGQGERFSIQTNDPRQSMGQHRPRQSTIAVFRPHHREFDHQPGFQRRCRARSIRALRHNGPCVRSVARTTCVRASRSHHCQRSRWHARIRQIIEHVGPVDPVKRASILQIGESDLRSRK